MKQKLFVISMDAMVREDVAELLKRPNFRKIMEKRAEVNEVCSVYPASTYPAHSTLITGCYPKGHGVYCNFSLQTHSDGVAHWPVESSGIFAEDIFSAAKKAGCTTAAVYWPITANNPNIDHVINEYFFYYPDEGIRVEEVFADQGADAAALSAVRENLRLFPRATAQGEPTETLFDSFLMGCTCSLIRDRRPDVLFVHNCCLDSLRHKGGVFGTGLPAALDRVDAWLGDVVSAMEEAGVYEDTNFVILSDHGQRDCTRTVRLNVLLEQEGLIRLSPKETVYTWQAYSQSNGMSSTVYLSDNTNEKLYERVYACLKKLQATGKYGIEKILTKEELAERYGQSGPFSFFVEAQEGVRFINDLTGDAVSTHPTVGAHGYMPEKGPKPIFMGRGPAFREGAVLEQARLVDAAPTLAAILGQTLPDADGRALTELLK
ncbi:MAG: alkaline phosphatase family protein [Ruminococcaceae bacterium]|nr:alkaline phosphatase family protein [Oscillospiraceae bacterium]